MSSDENLFDVEKFARELRIELISRGKSVRAAAPEMGISRSTLGRLIMADTVPNVEQYLRVQKWMTGVEG